MKDAYTDYIGTLIKNKEKASSKEYFDWIYDVIKRKHWYDDDAAIYEENNNLDSENGKILSSFTQYLETLAEEQGKPDLAENGGEFDAMRYYVHYRDLYFIHILMVGQGAVTIISDKLEDDFSEDKCIELVPR